MEGLTVALTLADKKAVVAKMSEVASESISVVAAYYHGLSVNDMTELRHQARSQGVDLHVIRNNLTKIAFKETQFECMSEILVGPLCLAFSKDAPSTAARVIQDFAKTHEHLKVKAISLSGKLLDGSQLKAVASLPNYDEALSKLMFVMKAPVEKFVRTLVQPHTKLVRTIEAIRVKKASES